MSNNNLVRPSRDGDQFHYLWAARRCLKLLSPECGLVAVSIEDPSPRELASEAVIEAGEELIDIAEYFGSEDIGQAWLVRYIQLKHSTLHANDTWSASGLEKTITGFAKRYAELQKIFPKAELAKKLEFCFVTNRPISTVVVEAFADAAAGEYPRHPHELAKLQKFTGLTESEFAEFCKLFRFEDCQDGYWDQRNILFQEAIGYLPDSDIDAPTQLKELVTRRALSEGKQNPTITKIDVLRALKTDESRLFPAECLIEINENAVQREQETEIISKIIDAKNPVIIHADGGVGKSVFAKRIGKNLPEGSVCILYDCFGNGQYRSTTGYRHRHKVALVQIANELARKGLCHPLIPTIHADSSAYVRTFVHRLTQVVKILQASNQNSLLCIVVDAADNAQMAATDIGEARSFALDLIRADIPEGVRLVFLCRTHRQHMLDPPIKTIPIELKPFSHNETKDFLRQTFSDANDHDINEFHRLSSQNPRVQALALSQNLSLHETLRLLGPNPTSVEDTIANLLDNAIAKLKDASGPIEKERIEKISAGLAALRPLIPIPILSAISGVEQEAIKSFAYDVGRPLLVAGETIQFFDEPAETWFREKFKPTAQAMAGFITSLKPLASRSAYVASILPQLMLEAGQFSEVVDLALSSTALPESSPLEKRDVELQRLQFALKAGLRSQRYLEATKLAFKAGGQTAGDERQRKLLQANTDLASKFLEVDLIQEIVSRRTFGSGWVGSHHAYEAALLSGRTELAGDARSRLRMAHEWLQNWGRLTPEEKDKERISDHDIVELTLAHLNIHGPEDAAESLSRWRPQEVSYRVGRLVIRRLIDHGRWPDIDAIAHAAGKNLCLILAIATELREVHRTPPSEVTKKAFRRLLKTRIKLSNNEAWDNRESTLDAVTAVVEAALKLKLCSQESAVAILTMYLPAEPTQGLASRYSNARFPLLRAYCLRSALEEKSIELIDVAHAELKREIESDKQHTTSRDLQEFQQDIGALLPWHKLWAAVLLGRVKKEDIPNEINKATETSLRANQIRYSEESHTSNETSLLRMGILHHSQAIDDANLKSFNQWKDRLKRPLFTSTLNALCRLCAQLEETKPTALSYAAESYKRTKDERSNAESKADEYLEVSRAILTTSPADAKSYFNEAMEVAGKIGDENLARWDAILDLADRASFIDRPVPKVAYQFARCAELTYDYVERDKHFAWNSTVIALCGLCPSSAIAILSRWRDRGFGWHERLLPYAIDNLIERNIINPCNAIPLVGFRAQWNYDKLLESALVSAKDMEVKALISRMLHRYAQFSDISSSQLKNIQLIADKNKITLERLADEIELSEKEDFLKNTGASRHEPLLSGMENKAQQWAEIFASKDITTAEGLSQAYLAFKKTNPWGYADFFTEAMQRVPIGLEAEFIEVIMSAPDFSIHNLKSFLEQVPESWKVRPAISHALENSLKVICRQYCVDVRKNRYYEPFPFDLASSLTSANQTEFIDVVLLATGESPDLIETSQLFSLVGLLAMKLSHDEALDALIYGLDLFNPVLEDTDGDGHWNNELLPPGDIQECIAGYIWSALAAPEAVLRWEAAHVVLELCRLNRQDIINHLMTMAANKSGGPFIDSRLPFYGLHAFQWLLIGMARAAMENPNAVAPYAEQLLDWALKDQPHVLIRQLAARTALQLISSGYLTNEDGLSDRLNAVNNSSLERIESITYERNTSRSREKNLNDDEDSFYFGIDIGPYWYSPLGRVFALSESDIETEALQVIRKDFAYGMKGRWDEDERARRNLYQEQHTHHHHGSYPRADNLHFYLAYHAMMIVAGKLLATIPMHHDPHYDVDNEFGEWLSRHDITRQDGRWLWDRRDPEPLKKGLWLSREKEHPNYRILTDFDFEDALQAGENFNLWGYWTENDSNREQSTHIYSALVAPDKSESLLRALATTKDLHDYSIPSAGCSREINNFGFELQGWVLDNEGNKQLDEYDRWAGGITFPPPSPAPFIVEQMRIEADTDLRFWKDQNSTYVLESQVWGYFDEAKRHDIGNTNRGSRLQASMPFIVSMLRELDRDLIIQVQIERHRRYRSYENGEKDDEERIKKRAKLFLISKDGKLRTC